MCPVIVLGGPLGWQRLAQRFLFRFLSNVVALFVASLVFPGIDHGSFWTLVLAGLVFSLVNAVVRPIVVLLALPAVVLTLGLGLLLVNALMLWLTGQIVGSFDVSGFWTAVGGAVIVWLANTALEAILKPEARPTRPAATGQR
ncbi:MAG: phage holin family protein [Thermoleophilia bacterium]|nr:phage holin family protein [Thermoleophilia bacterium]